MNGQKFLQDDFSKIDPEILDNFCKEKGKLFAEGESSGDKKINKVSTSKLRNFFSKITSIRTYYRNPGQVSLDDFHLKIKREITLLKPTLAYAYGRDKNLVNFYTITVDLIQKTINAFDKELNIKKNETKKDNKEPNFKFDSLENFFTIIEGFVAYHKFYGGQE